LPELTKYYRENLVLKLVNVLITRRLREIIIWGGSEYSENSEHSERPENPGDSGDSENSENSEGSEDPERSENSEDSEDSEGSENSENSESSDGGREEKFRVGMGFNLAFFSYICSRKCFDLLEPPLQWESTFLIALFNEKRGLYSSYYIV